MLTVHLVDYKCANRLGYEKLLEVSRLNPTTEEIEKMGVVLVESPEMRLMGKWGSFPIFVTRNSGQPGGRRSRGKAP